MLAVLEQVIVPPLPEAPFVGRVARVRAKPVAVPSLAVPPTRHCDHTDTFPEFEEEEVEKELKMFDGSIGHYEHSSFRPRSFSRHYLAERCEDGWSCTSAHGEQAPHPAALRGADRGRARAADHG